MELEVERITHYPDRKPPLTVEFFDMDDESDKTYTINVDASAVQTFHGFQRVVMNRLGLFVRNKWVENAKSSKEAAKQWADIIDAACIEGKRQ